MNKILIILALALMACSGQEPEITSLEMLEGGKTFAVTAGSVADEFVLQRFPDARIRYYNTNLDCAMAVVRGKAHAACYDQPVLKNIASKNKGMTVLPEFLVDDQYGFAVQLGNNAMKQAMDQVLAEIRANGIYDEMLQRWFPLQGPPAPMPEFSFTGKNGILRFGTCAVVEPMAFWDEKRKPAGFDIELASYIALRLDKELVIVDLAFGSLLPALISGKVDMIGAGISITEERMQKVLFSEPYYKSGIAALVRKKNP